MPTVTPLLTHAYLDKKRLTLAELKATASVSVVLTDGSLLTYSGYNKNYFEISRLVYYFYINNNDKEYIPSPAQHNYLDEKDLTLAELNAAAGVQIFIRETTVSIGNGKFWRGPAIIRKFEDVFANDELGEQILAKKVDYLGKGKLQNKLTLAGGHNSTGLTPFGFFIKQLPTLTGKIIVVMGLADGYRLHQATGLPVICGAGEGNIKSLCEQIRLVNKTITVIAAGDNDYAGITNVHKTNCPYLLPSTEKDWSDIYQNEGPEALVKEADNIKPPLPLFPDPFYPRYQKRKTLTHDLNKEVLKLSRCKTDTGEPDMAQATGRVMSIFSKYEFRMPFEVNINEFTKPLVLACKHTLNYQNIEHIRDIIKDRIKNRKTNSLSLTNFNRQVKSRHDVKLRTGIPALTEDDFHGVVLIRAPQGLGKNDYIAAPFIDRAKLKGFTLAMCHSMSLSDDLSNRLELTHYRKDEFNIMKILGLAICLPSISKDKFDCFLDNLKYLFVDEISAVLNFLKARECSTKGKNNSHVYKKLKQLITNADCILGVDAELNDMVIEFIEQCRPDERFTIYDINEKHKKHNPKNFKEINPYPAAKRNINYIAGKNSTTQGYGDIFARIIEGQNLWISSESCEKTNELEALILKTKPNTKILVLNSNNKGKLAQQKFFNDADEESKKYQVIIHSPVITSGISVKHQNKVTRKTEPHFHHGYFIGSGHCITPSTASQMMSRVRYLNNLTVVLIPNNTIQAVKDARAIIIGKEQAALFEVIQNENSDLYEQGVAKLNLYAYETVPVDDPYRATEFDKFCAKIEEANELAKADFSSGLLWLLQDKGHTVEPFLKHYDDIDKDIKATKEAAREQYAQELISANNINGKTYQGHKIKPFKTWEETCEFQKYYIKQCLNLKELTKKDIEIFDGGQVMVEMRRFAACFNNTAFKEKENIEHLYHREFSKAKVWAYQLIFEGIDLTGQKLLTQHQATEIIERVIEHRYVFSQLGIVPAKFGKYYKLINGKDNFPFPKTPMKDVQSIFKLMGLKLLKRKDNYHRAKKVNDYEINVSILREKQAFCDHIDFSRLGGYLLNESTISAETNAKIWKEVQTRTRQIVEIFHDDTELAISYLHKECDKHEFDKENVEIKQFFAEIDRMAG
ncbi:MAG: toprim domain-containing protein [Alteromonadaceae bacterium]|nr:toprim domain-containing protein [Alteromonadaceae bacterium]